MSAISKEVATEMLNLYIEAEKAILINQSYTFKNRTYTRANLNEVVRERQRWQNYVDSLSGTNSIRIIPVAPNW
jgi:hypothetical protein